MLVTVSILGLAIIIVWNVWAFGTVAQGGSLGAPVTSAPPLFNRSSIDAINTVFENRAAEESKYVTGVYHYIDPSQ